MHRKLRFNPKRNRIKLHAARSDHGRGGVHRAQFAIIADHVHPDLQLLHLAQVAGGEPGSSTRL